MGGRFILNTRPAVYRTRTEAAFAPAGLPVIHWAVLSPRATQFVWPSPSDYDAVLFTSQVAVVIAPAAWRTVTAYAVGEGTAEAARNEGFARVVQTGQDAADMVAALKPAPFRRAFYASGADVTADLAAAFPGKVERGTVYEMMAEEQVPEAIAQQIGASSVIAPLFSRRSADVLVRLLTRASLSNRPIDAVGISAGVFEAEGPWHSRNVAAAPTLEAVAAEVIRLAQNEVRP